MDTETVVMVVGQFVLAIAAGMLGLGVAFAAVPFLSLIRAYCAPLGAFGARPLPR